MRIKETTAEIKSTQTEILSSCIQSEKETVSILCLKEMKTFSTVVCRSAVRVFLVIRAPGCVFPAAVHYNSTEALVLLPVRSLMLAAA